jgi:hypothetical protein
MANSAPRRRAVGPCRVVGQVEQGIGAAEADLLGDDRRVAGAVSPQVQQQGFGELAVRVAQCQPLVGSEVLRDQVQQQRRFAGAGLPDEVEMGCRASAARMTSSPEMRVPLRSSCGEALMGGTEPVCRAHRRVE